MGFHGTDGHSIPGLEPFRKHYMDFSCQSPHAQSQSNVRLTDINDRFPVSQ